MNFDFNIKHIKGEDNGIPDALSRLFNKEEKKITIKKIELINEKDIESHMMDVHEKGHFGAENISKILKWNGKKKCIQLIKKCEICQKWSNSKPLYSEIKPLFVEIKNKEFRYKARDKLLQLYCLDTFTGPIYSAFGHFS